MEYAVYLWNHLPSEAGITPMGIWTVNKQNSDLLRNEKVWGCPAYVLDPKV